MGVYDRAVGAVKPEEKKEMFLLYIKKATDFFGVTKTREIYQRAIEELPEPDMRAMCLKYADMERKLGEIDRARAIYVYTSQFCDPQKEDIFWKVYSNFNSLTKQRKKGKERKFHPPRNS